MYIYIYIYVCFFVGLEVLLVEEDILSPQGRGNPSARGRRETSNLEVKLRVVSPDVPILSNKRTGERRIGLILCGD